MNKQKKSKEQQRASETITQRTSRLDRLRQSQRTRLANETKEQRAARLQQLRQSRETRISNETEEQRAARCCNSDNLEMPEFLTSFTKFSTYYY